MEYLDDLGDFFPRSQAGLRSPLAIARPIEAGGACVQESCLESIIIKSQQV